MTPQEQQAMREDAVTKMRELFLDVERIAGQSGVPPYHPAMIAFRDTHRVLCDEVQGRRT
jgi:hypothetical protein